MTDRGLKRDTSNQVEPWVPTDADIQWQRDLFARMPNGAHWMVPATESVYVFDTRGKKLLLTKGDPAHSLNIRIRQVTEALGWTVVEVNL